MSQRWYATLVAVPLLFALFLAAVFVPLPFVTYSPGPTVDVLGEDHDKEIIQVSGHRTYRDSGELRMTTVYVTQPNGSVGLLEAIRAWLSPVEAVYPRSAIYPEGETQEQADQESAAQMVSSQDAATAAALTELGYDVTRVQVNEVASGMPAQGKLEVGDVLMKIGGTEITGPVDVVTAIEGAEAGKPLTFVVERAGKPVNVQITPKLVDGKPRIGIAPGTAFDFPFEVSVDISDSIGGPSAGLMFSLAIYDTLTPGSLTQGHDVAGTGTIDETGKVGPIGGIQQKIAGARDDGAELFLVPADNCAEALGARPGTMRLVKATTMPDALASVLAWAKDPHASLPTCTKGGQ